MPTFTSTTKISHASPDQKKEDSCGRTECKAYSSAPSRDAQSLQAQIAASYAPSIQETPGHLNGTSTSNDDSETPVGSGQGKDAELLEAEDILIEGQTEPPEGLDEIESKSGSSSANSYSNE
ncbi:hypothetical protein ACJ73_02556 [Blastomyces percursus]|uniref:Uncharacterized protein n=1 Tax=Blastomyces percursus TaxID=1658174 RepID=A0A1J9QDB2_9EURO|nr:hypothetical protein ACJ73_02556 [Blastomyces percursus]